MSDQPLGTTASLDVFILTFNAAKEQINPYVFALHLRNAFAKNASTLPEIIVLYVCLPTTQDFCRVLSFLFLQIPPGDGASRAQLHRLLHDQPLFPELGDCHKPCC